MHRGSELWDAWTKSSQPARVEAGTLGSIGATSGCPESGTNAFVLDVRYIEIHLIYINVGIAILNHPPFITIKGWYKPSKIGVLLLLYPQYGIYWIKLFITNDPINDIQCLEPISVEGARNQIPENCTGVPDTVRPRSFGLEVPGRMCWPKKAQIPRKIEKVFG